MIIDPPTFTVTFNQDESVASVTCNKTYAECKYNSDIHYAQLQLAYYDGFTEEYIGNVYTNRPTLNYISYLFYSRNIPQFLITYNGDGTIEFEESAPNVYSETITENGTYTPGNGQLYNEVIVNVPGGGSSSSVSGLEYEEGTWTPSEDLQSTWITFSNAHTVAPFYYMIMDVTATYNSTSNSNGGIVYYNWGQVFGEPLHISSSSVRYGVGRKFISNGSSSANNITQPYTNNTDSSASYSRYWAKETGIKADSYSNGYFWRAGRTYKWIAVWTPTT